MATCQTKRWVSTSPYVKLTVTEVADYSDIATKARLSYKLEYISDSAASTSVAKAYSITIGGSVVKSGTYDINKKTGTNTITSGTIDVNRGTAALTVACSVTFKFEMTWSGVRCPQQTASTSISVGAKTQYAIIYNANGGSGAPSTQYKWHGVSVTLSSTKPTRTGYTFKGWKGTTAETIYQPGASYTANATVTLYAQWEANTYRVTYNANGGTGAPAAQTKTHGTNLTLSTSKPERTNYTFKGWSKSAAGAVSYQPGETYTFNAALTLYAVWELSYVLPKIYNVSVFWSNQEPEFDSNGVEYRKIGAVFCWETTKANPTAKASIYDTNGELVGSAEGVLSGNVNDVGVTLNLSTSFRTDMTYTLKITIDDGGGSTTVTATLTGNIYPIDVLAEGKGISFGGPATLEDTAHFQWAVRFDKPVHGMVRGLGKLPKIEPGSDFNAETYRNFGVWAVYGNADSLDINNMPPLYLYSDPTGATSNRWVGRAGILEVSSPTGEGMRSAEWSYVRQRFIPYSLSFPVMERDITRNDSNTWSYGGWYKTSLSVKDEPVTLYSGNASGAVTLSQAASNFEYLEIFFTDNNGEKGGYTKIHTPYTGSINLSIIEAGGTTTHIRRTSYTISGATMTPDTTNAGFVKLTGTAVSHTTGTNYIRITRIVGRNS